MVLNLHQTQYFLSNYDEWVRAHWSFIDNLLIRNSSSIFHNNFINILIENSIYQLAY